jgi:membrane protease YdiL (CAAX protease family)
MAPELERQTTPSEAPRWRALWALVPIATTLLYYVLPSSFQDQTVVQFVPQWTAYAAMALWAYHHDAIPSRLGLKWEGFGHGLRWGLLTGLILGGLNTVIILIIVPSLGHEVTFLKHTPHARVPFLLMVPWLICAIAVFVEINFRGFVLGRLAELESAVWKSTALRRLSPLALVISALTFAFDPFMVNTFKHLHWIALWDGLIWGVIWLRTRNLCMTIVAHAAEVLVLYLAIREALD